MREVLRKDNTITIFETFENGGCQGSYFTFHEELGRWNPTFAARRPEEATTVQRSFRGHRTIERLGGPARLASVELTGPARAAWQLTDEAFDEPWRLERLD